MATEGKPPEATRGSTTAEASATPLTASQPPAKGPHRWSNLLDQLSAVAGVVAPTTVLTALLYYYGYVATYARFAYFGVDLATLRLPTQELVLRSVAVLY